MRLAALAMFVSFLFFLSPSTAAYAQQAPSPSNAVTSGSVPGLFSFSGTLTDLNGNVLTGVTGVTFSLYKDQQEGAPLWMETQNVYPDKTGHYTVTPRRKHMALKYRVLRIAALLFVLGFASVAMAQCSGDGYIMSCFGDGERNIEQPVDLFWGPGSFYGGGYPAPGDGWSVSLDSGAYSTFPGGVVGSFGIDFIQPHMALGENLGLPPGINVPPPTIWDALGIQLPMSGGFWAAVRSYYECGTE